MSLVRININSLSLWIIPWGTWPLLKIKITNPIKLIVSILILFSISFERSESKSFAYVVRLHRCLWRMLETKCVGDGFGHFCHQHPLSFYISVGQQHSKDVTDITVTMQYPILFRPNKNMIVICWNFTWSNERMRVKTTWSC